ncbi:MAG: hypothetical protein ACFFB5_00980 [Promethearchaeota archaeon]
MSDDALSIEGLLKTALNYGKRYIYRTLSDILKEWSLDPFLEDNQFQY